MRIDHSPLAHFGNAHEVTDRTVILAAVAESAGHPYIEEIHRRAQENDPRISLSKVHALLTLLVHERLVDRRQFGRSRPRYVLTPRAADIILATFRD